MEYKLSKKVTSLQASAIREILKHTGEPGVISFAAGSPSSEAFPLENLKKISTEILDEDPILALQYNITEGYTPLREVVKQRLTSMNCFNPEKDDVIITSGAQQGNELTCKVLCDFGEKMICEAPSFIGSLNAFRSYGVELCGVSLEDDGVNLEELENAMKNGDAKLFYIIPNFQNPTGKTTSYEKRKAIYELAKKYEVVILEDNPYGDLRFEGEDIPSIKTLDKDGLVVYAGTFSKILAPGLRVGYIAGPKEIIQKCVVCKQVADVHSNIWAQLMCYKFMKTVNLDDHLASLRKIYKRKCNLMISKMKECFSDDITFTAPEGGMFIWATLPDGKDVNEFCKRAIEEYKIAVVPGNAFAINDEKSHSFRLNFSTPSDEDIIKGIEILGKLTKSI
jgi:2-aminoadipate transaminase